MKCPRCNNEDPKYFAYDKGMYYCRKCISFSRVNVGDVIKPCSLSHKIWKGRPVLDFELSKEQKSCSRQALEYLKQAKDVFVFAATGAGKTEITFESICYYLASGKKVAFAISRRQVVLEIAKRLETAFPKLSVVAVAQDYTSVTDGDLIVCTMHQLYRYPRGFDLLILDEVDAFPYAGNDVLEAIVDLSCKGQKLYLSATPSQEILMKMERKEMEVVRLFKRPHGHPLVVPKVYYGGVLQHIVYTIWFCLSCKKQGKQVLVFVPKREDCLWLSFLLNIFLKTRGIHSQSEEKDRILDQFRKKELNVLVCTTLLERGITIGRVQVVVYHADHGVFTAASLVQIFGRIGRSFQDPSGKGVCLCQTKSASVQECVSILENMNHSV